MSNLINKTFINFVVSEGLLVTTWIPGQNVEPLEWGLSTSAPSFRQPLKLEVHQ